MKLESQIKKQKTSKALAGLWALAGVMAVGMFVATYIAGRVDGRRSERRERDDLAHLVIQHSKARFEAQSQIALAHDGWNECIHKLRSATEEAHSWRAIADSLNEPKLWAETATFNNDRYQTIYIQAPGYKCRRDGEGWMCER